jgi:hypothetical protein
VSASRSDASVQQRLIAPMSVKFALLTTALKCFHLVLQANICGNRPQLPIDEPQDAFYYLVCISFAYKLKIINYVAEIHIRLAG